MGGRRAACHQAHGGRDPRQPQEPHLPSPRLRSVLSRLRLRRHHRVQPPCTRAGSHHAADHDPPQSVPLGPLQAPPHRGGQAPRRRLRGGLPSALRRGVAVHSPREGRASRSPPPALAGGVAASRAALSARAGGEPLQGDAEAQGGGRLQGRAAVHQRRSHPQRRLLLVAQGALAKSGHRPEEIGAVLFCSCTSVKMMPSLATWLSGQLGVFQTHASCDIVAACAGLPYGLSEAVRLLQEVERPILVVCGEKFSDKIGTVRTSRMIFGDGAAALVIAPAPAGAPPDVEVLQTYASGPMSEVDSIIWPNPEFDNNITVYGPEVRALVKRYLGQMLGELRALPHPEGKAGASLLDAVDLVVPHQANKTMVVSIAEAAGVAAERLYFNIDKVGNTSSASIPIALHDAVREGVITRPLRIFAPGFGAGAVGGYAVLRVDPAVVA